MTTSFKISISIQSGSLPGSRCTFESEQSIIVGKDSNCGLKLDARGVSRKHCRIEGDGGGWRILDLGSTNGIVVNGKVYAGHEQPVMKSPIPLTDGDEIGIGEAILRIEIESEPEYRTEIVVPKKSGAHDDLQTELLTPKQMTSSVPRKLSASPNAGNKNVPNPMNRPQTVSIHSPKSPQPQSSPNDSDNSLATQEFSPTPSFFAITVPSEFRHYRLEKRVGVGGMGEVFLATDVASPKHQWAIKFLKTQADQSTMDRARFLREMEIALNMQHNSLIRCVDCGDEDGQLFIVMDYCNGGNLTELLKRSGKLNVRRAVRLMDRLLAGIEFAHQKGIVHRDLKPSNILLHKEAGRKYLPKISDFGLAKSYLQAGDSGMTVNGTVGGSWGYMPKEQLTNFRFVSPQSDVWSLGAILYECLTLKLPRPIEKGSDPIRTILESKIVPIQDLMPDIHPAIERFVKKCLARETEDRFKDASAMRTALKVTANKSGVEL